MESATLTATSGARELVRAAIANALRRGAIIDAEGILVVADGCDVWLGGEVRSWAVRQDAEDAAWATPGVRFVRNDIHLRCPQVGELP